MLTVNTVLDGVDSTVCVLGNWTADDVECERVTCPPPPDTLPHQIPWNNTQLFEVNTLILIV